jgi:hypothetical protein
VHDGLAHAMDGGAIQRTIGMSLHHSGNATHV